MVSTGLFVVIIFVEFIILYLIRFFQHYNDSHVMIYSFSCLIWWFWLPSYPYMSGLVSWYFPFWLFFPFLCWWRLCSLCTSTGCILFAVLSLLLHRIVFYVSWGFVWSFPGQYLRRIVMSVVTCFLFFKLPGGLCHCISLYVPMLYHYFHSSDMLVFCCFSMFLFSITIW